MRMARIWSASGYGFDRDRGHVGAMAECGGPRVPERAGWVPAAYHNEPMATVWFPLGTEVANRRGLWYIMDAARAAPCAGYGPTSAGDIFRDQE